MSEGKKTPQIIAAVCVCIGALGTGTVIGWTSNINQDLKNGKLNDLEFKTNYQNGLVASLMPIGAMVSCLPIGFIADLIGRKLTMLCTAIPFTFGWILITCAQHEAMVYTGRFLVGVAGGSYCVMVPLYTSEISQTSIRGFLGSFLQVFITLGVLYTNVLGYALSMLAFNIACTFVPVIFAIAFFFQPETPYYHLKRDRPEKAEKALQRLRGKDYDFSDEMKQIQEQVAEKVTFDMFKETMKTPQAKKATLICFMLMFYQQLSGVNAVLFYLITIFTEAGSSLSEPWCVIIVGIVGFMSSAISTGTIEKVGRKILLMASAALMSFSLLLLGIFFLVKNHDLASEDTLRKIGFIPVLSLTLFIIGFSTGLGPIPWLASSEIFPLEVKANCSSAAGVFNWFLAAVVGFFYPKISSVIGNDITFFIFAGITVTCIPFVLFVMPETKGKTFQEIQTELAS